MKLTFKEFLSEAKKNIFQVKIESGAGGSWDDIAMHADSLEDIAASVSANSHEQDKMDKFDISQLTEVVTDWIGEGPNGPGTHWDEMDMSVLSLKDDVLKVQYFFSGLRLRGKFDADEVKKKGIITIMSGN